MIEISRSASGHQEPFDGKPYRAANDWEEPFNFQGWLALPDPQRPDDDFMDDGCLLIFKLPFDEH